MAEEAERTAFVVGLAPPALVAPVLANLDESIAEGPLPFEDTDCPWTPSWFVHDNFDFPRSDEWPFEMRCAGEALRSHEPAGRLAEAAAGRWQDVAVDCGAICEDVEKALVMFNPQIDHYGTLGDIVTAVEQRSAIGEELEPEALYEEAMAWADQRGHTRFEKCLDVVTGCTWRHPEP